MRKIVVITVIITLSIFLSACLGQNKKTSDSEPGDMFIHNRADLNKSLHVEILDNNSTVLFEENYTLAPGLSVEVEDVVNETGVYNVTVTTGGMTSIGVWKASSCNHHLEIYIASEGIAVGTLIGDTFTPCPGAE